GSAPPHTTGSALSRATLLRVAVAGMAGIAGGAVLAQGSRADARVTPAHTRRAGNGYETYSYVAEGETIGDDGYNLGAFYEVDQTGPSALATYHNGVLVYGNVTGVTGYLTEGGPYGAVAGVLGEAQTYANFTGNFQNATLCGGVSPGVKGRSGSGAGVFGTSISTTPTTYTTDIADATGPGIGVLGTSHSGVGVSGISQTAAGVTGT